MIIECGHCGAPLDVKKGDRTAKCTYCATSNQVQTTRTVAFETPPDWRPPPQWIPPAHFAADSSKTLTYHAVRAVSGVVRAIITMAIVGVFAVGAIAFFVAQRGNSLRTQISTEVSRSVSETVQRSVEGSGQAEAERIIQDVQKQLEKAGIPGAAVGGNTGSQVSLLTSAGITEALDAYKKALGVSKLAATRLTFHDGHSSLEAQSPKNPSHVDRYMYRAGSVSAPDPQRLSSRDKQTLKARLFDPEVTALTKLEELKTTALGKLAYENTKISHVIVERRSGKTEILVYGSSPRESGYVRFSADGKVVRVYR